MNLKEKIAYNTIKYFLMSVIIVTGVSIPFIFWRRGDFAGRVVAVFWGLMVVAGAAWITTKSMSYAWKRGRQKKEG